MEPIIFWDVIGIGEKRIWLDRVAGLRFSVRVEDVVGI